MKKVFYNNWLAKVLLYSSTCHTIMLCGFVFSKQKECEMTQATRNHKCIHARQWFETTALAGTIILALALVFNISAWWMLLSGVIYYVWYVLEWVIKGVNYSIMADEWTCDLETPYEAISFEREARKAEKDCNYVENRNLFAWLRFL